MNRIRKRCGQDWVARAREREKNRCGSRETPGSVDDKLEFLLLQPASCLAATYQRIIPEQTRSVERGFWPPGCRGAGVHMFMQSDYALAN